MRGLRAALAAVVMACGFAGAAQAAPAMWVVRDADSEIYLFGSLHALPPGSPWRTPAYDAAFAKASTVWFEADVEVDRKALVALVARYGVDRNQPLSGKLAPADARRLHAALARRGMGPNSVDHLRPWVVALMLSMGPVRGRGGAIEHGVDMVAVRETKASPKAFRTFETAEDQIRIFADLPEPAQLNYLSEVLQAQTPRLAWPRPSFQDRWLAGRVERDTTEGDPDLRRALLTRRNQTWAEAIAREMDGQGVQLVTVGALHMAGDDGLPALLRARGFEVDRVQ